MCEAAMLGKLMVDHLKIFIISMIEGRLVYMRMATRRFSRFIRSATTIYDLPPITGDQFEFGLKVDLGAQLGKRQGAYCLFLVSGGDGKFASNISDDETQIYTD